MTRALEAFAEQLQTRVDAYWFDCEDCGMWFDVQNRFGSASDWDDPKEGAHFLWKKAGWNPDLELPRPSLVNPREDTDFRSSVAFDGFDTDYWFSSSTAVFFSTMTWGSLGPDFPSVTMMPSLGQSQQHASGLMGAWRLWLEDPRPQPSQSSVPGMKHRWRVVSLGWDMYGTYPIWENLHWGDAAPPPGRHGIPFSYQDDVASGDHGFADSDEMLAFLLPEDLRSPYLLPLGSVVSYSLGWLALTYGLTVIVNEWQGINEVLASVTLQGFAPAT